MSREIKKKIIFSDISKSDYKMIVCDDEIEIPENNQKIVLLQTVPYIS